MYKYLAIIFICFLVGCEKQDNSRKKHYITKYEIRHFQNGKETLYVTDTWAGGSQGSYIHFTIDDKKVYVSIPYEIKEIHVEE